MESLRISARCQAKVYSKHMCYMQNGEMTEGGEGAELRAMNFTVSIMGERSTGSHCISMADNDM